MIDTGPCSVHGGRGVAHTYSTSLPTWHCKWRRVCGLRPAPNLRAWHTLSTSALAAASRHRSDTVYGTNLFLVHKCRDKHEWIIAENGIRTVRINNFVQEALGDVVYYSLPEVQTKLKKKKMSLVLWNVWKLQANSLFVYQKLLTLTKLLLQTQESSANLVRDGWLIKMTLINSYKLHQLMSEENHQYGLT